MSDRLGLAQTCRALRWIILQSPVCLSNQRHVPGDSLQKLMTKHEQLDYLSIMTRDRIDSWVCDRCTAVHRVGLDNTIGKASFARWQTACPAASKDDPEILYLEKWAELNRFEMRHDLVQTALKFIRQWKTIGRERQKYVVDILQKAYHGPLSFHRSLYPTKLYVTHERWMHPKVVSDPAHPVGSGRLKFVVSIISTCFYRSGTDMGPRDIPYVRACVHCLYEPLAWALSLDRTMPDYRPMCEMVRDARSRADNTPIFGACSMCATDFSFHFRRGSPRKAVWQIWQDLGGEGSMTDPAWRALHEIPYRIENQPDKPPSAQHHHEPGSVMRMYEEGRGVAFTSPPQTETMDLPRLARGRPFYVTDPLDERLLSEEQRIYRLEALGVEIGWSIHDF